MTTEAPPLDGILIIALEQAVAGPLCSSRLADAGARVIKIERLEGDFARNYDHVVDGESAYFVWLNRGEESLTLDIKNPGDLSVLKAILRKADIYIQNLAPGAAARAGVGSEEMREANPQLRTIGCPTQNGEVGVIAPALVDLADDTTYRPVPALGEHSEAIRKEFAA